MNHNKMKALSLKDFGGHQNYAHLVATGFKIIETRRWKTNYRGDILICCSKSSKSNNAGLALCVVKLVDIVPMTKEHEIKACCSVYDGAWAWILEDIRPLSRKFPIKGALSLFEAEIPEDIKY